MPIFAHKDLDVGYLQKICRVVAMPFVKVKDHIENVGKGKQAIEYAEKSYQIIEKQQNTILTLANKDEAAKLAVEKLTNCSIELNKVHTETNNILSGVLQFGQVVGTACSFVYIGKAGYDLGHWVYRYFWPSQESIVRKKLVDQEIKTINTRAALNKCLSNNLMMERNAFSVPIKCEDEARLFLEVAGIKEYNKVVKALKKNQEI